MRKDLESLFYIELLFSLSCNKLNTEPCAFRRACLDELNKPVYDGRSDFLALILGSYNNVYYGKIHSVSNDSSHGYGKIAVFGKYEVYTIIDRFF